MAFVRSPFKLANVGHTADAFGADLILLDYVQRIGPPKEYSDNRLSLNAVMNAVRGFADCGCAVVVVSAVGRQPGKNGGSGYSDLNLASFRESSELEYGCDSAYLLIRKEKTAKATLRCVKNRNDEQKDINLLFDGEYQRFDPDEGDNAPVAMMPRANKGSKPQGSDWS